jgi:hypothetical protein
MAEYCKLWDTIPAAPDGMDAYGESGTRLYLMDNKVTFEYKDFDHEDSRLYEYSASFSKDDYIAAIDQLQTWGKTKLTCDSGILEFVLNSQKKYVQMKFSGVPEPASTPGGASLRGSINLSCTLDQLMLRK